MINITRKKLLLYLSLLIAFAVFIFIFIFSINKINAGINKTQWGLGNYGDGAQPVGNADKETLNKYNAIYVGNSKDKTIYLTFDAGYENGYMKKILKTLKEKNVKACFFIVGNYIQRNPELVKEMIKEGHIVANHTNHHKDPRTLSKDELTYEITSLEKMYKDVTGKEMKKYFRPPEGSFNENVLTYANELGYKTVFWSLAYNDWNNNQQKSYDTVYSTIMPKLHNGCILLLHATSKTNSDVLGSLIDKIKGEGYTFKSLDEFK